MPEMGVRLHTVSIYASYFDITLRLISLVVSYKYVFGQPSKFVRSCARDRAFGFYSVPFKFRMQKLKVYTLMQIGAMALFPSHDSIRFARVLPGREVKWVTHSSFSRSQSPKWRRQKAQSGIRVLLLLNSSSLIANRNIVRPPDADDIFSRNQCVDAYSDTYAQ